MKYHLKVFDNFHYGDESEAYDYGKFETYHEALIAAKAIVDEFLKTNWQPGIKSDDLLTQYIIYGEDPIILPPQPSNNKSFSARTYAKSMVVEICEKLGNK